MSETPDAVPEDDADSSITFQALGFTLPKPIERNLWKAAGRILTGLTNVPLALIEGRVRLIQGSYLIKDNLRREAAAQIAERMKGGDRVAVAAIDYSAEDIIRSQAVRGEILSKTF
jgi:hypothetical protein